MAWPPATDVAGARHEELRAFVRYSLSQLRNRNEHHRFEHLCEALARQRITPNIVVGSGPVSSGGDQGRDFETFVGFTQGHMRDLGEQIGIGDRDTIVFCCTVGHADVPKKVRKDIKALTSTGTDVDVVVYFSEQDVSAAERHKLIEAAQTEHGVRLEILDGQTLTGILCDRDTFWIAVEFLDVPAHLAPDDAGPNWYATSRARWLARTAPASTSGDVVELATCVRFATFNEAFRGDLEMWLARLAPLLDDDADPVLQRRARYETVVARYRGLGDLRPADDVVRCILRDAAASASADELDSADIISQYAQGAWMFAATELTAAEIDDLSTNLEDQLVRLTSAVRTPDRRCRLLSLLGRTRLRFNLRKLETDGFKRGEVEPRPPMTTEQWEQFLAHHPVQSRERRTDFVNTDGAVTAWCEAVDLLDQAPFFPVRAFAEVVALRAGALHDDDRWELLVSRLDSNVASAAGRHAAADLARSRSRSLRAVGRPFAALTELHRARADLVSGDSRDEGAEALLDAAEVYLDLGLLYAAKHYALAAGAIAGADEMEEHPLIASSLILAAQCDFLAGNWFSLLASLPNALGAHINLREAPDEIGQWEDLSRLVWSVGTVTQFVERAAMPDLTDWLRERLTAAGIDQNDLVGGGVPSLLPDADFDTTMEFVFAQLGQPAFGDVGPTRAIRFAARGVRWRILARNTYDDVRAAERLAAAVQTVIAALGDDDLVLADTTIEIKIKTAPPRQSGNVVGRRPKETGAADGAHRWEATLTRDLGPHSVEALAATGEVAGIATAILMSVSLLPRESAISILERVGEDGSLIRAVFPHIRYDRAYAVLPTKDFAETERRRFSPMGREGFGEPVMANDLDPIQNPGPVFRGETPEERVSGRYDVYAKILRLTVPRLASDERVLAIVAELRGEGWKDWHLLMAISNLVINFRLQQSGESIEDPAVLERILRFEPEDPAEEQIDAGAVTAAALRMHLMVSTGATADAFGLEVGRALGPEELLELLATRYGYWDYDVEHDDPFPMANERGQ